MDKIILKDIVFPANIGVTDEERRNKQDVAVDIELCLDLRQAGGEDRLDASADYLAARDEVKRTAAKREYRLLEAMAQDIADALLAKFRLLEGVVVRARKPGLADPQGPVYAAIEIVRRRHA